MSYDIDLSGRVAMVTGASSGLGAQFARTLAKAGAGVVLAARRIERLKTLRAEIEADGGDAHVVALDVTDTDSIKAAVAHAETEMGTLVMTVGPENKVAPRPVKAGEWYGKDWVILGGLNAGDKVIVDNLIKLRPGMPVAPKDPAAAPQGMGGMAPARAAISAPEAVHPGMAEVLSAQRGCGFSSAGFRLITL